jgi:hypothetical protein
MVSFVGGLLHEHANHGSELLVAFASHYAHHARGVQNKEIRTVTLVKHMRNFMNLVRCLTMSFRLGPQYLW